MRLIRLLGGVLKGVREEENIVELIIEKGGKKYKIIFYPSIDATYDDCTINDDECYDLVQLYDVEELH